MLETTQEREQLRWNANSVAVTDKLDNSYNKLQEV